MSTSDKQSNSDTYFDHVDVQTRAEEAAARGEAYVIPEKA
jgi:hypothetical protein